jgi:hypothetical protein
MRLVLDPGVRRFTDGHVVVDVESGGGSPGRVAVLVDQGGADAFDDVRSADHVASET